MGVPILARNLRDQRRALVWWSLGVAAFAGIVLAAYPSVRDAPGIEELMESYPPALKALFGALEDFRTPAGFIRSELFSFMGPVLLLVYAIGKGAQGVAGEEEQGTLDLLLSYPVRRGRVVLEKAGGMAAGAGVITLVLCGTLAGGAVGMDLDLPATHVAGQCLLLLLLAGLFGALALAVGASTGRKGAAVGVAAAVAVLTYLVNGLADVAEFLEPARPLSPFYYYTRGDSIVNGLAWPDAGVLAGATLVLLAVAVRGFERRDVGV